MPLSAVAKVSLLVALGLVLALSGLLSYILFPQILQWQVEENLILSPDAEPFEYWKEVPVPIYCRFYFFNVTNADQVLSMNEKAELKELGPYTFREARTKVNITWNENGTVSYKQIKRWYFDPDKTVGSLDDLITTVNVPMVTAATLARLADDEPYMQAIESVIFHVNSTLFVTQPVRKLLFEGYTEELLSTAKDIGLQDIPYEKFGWFFAKNNSDDGIYTIYTGENNVDNYGHIDNWNGVRNLNGASHPCSVISGTAGDMWPPFRKSRKDKLELFVSDICSVLRLSFLKDVEKNEIESFRYWLDASTFNDPEDDNRRCCSEECLLPQGALDIHECQHGAPALVSFPHFLYADSQYRQQVNGLNPDPKKHTFIIDLEPKLGIPVNVDAKLQINIAFPKPHDFSEITFPNKTIYYPVFWFSESAEINLETAEKLRFVTKSLPQYVTVGAFLFVIIGGLVLVLTFHYTIRRVKSRAHRQVVYTAVIPQQKGEF